MEYHPLYGPSVPEKGWVPAPSFLLRRDRIHRLLAGLHPGFLLEIGCGAGTLLHELGRQGFTCEAMETSTAALEVAKYVNSGKATIYGLPQPDWVGKFDYILSFEVLEHIEDDHNALALWYSWLKPGGTMILSVPAHMNKWTASDVWAGHYRRYEMQQLADLITATGFTIESIETYGFPLSNILLPLRARVHARDLAQRDALANDRTRNNDMSGVERSTESRLYPLLKSFPGIMAMRIALFLQDMSSKKDWGTGYLLSGRKPNGQTL
jgi:SAM-dependent methyltransferase